MTDGRNENVFFLLCFSSFDSFFMLFGERKEHPQIACGLRLCECGSVRTPISISFIRPSISIFIDLFSYAKIKYKRAQQRQARRARRASEKLQFPPDQIYCINRWAVWLHRKARPFNRNRAARGRFIVPNVSFRWSKCNGIFRHSSIVLPATWFCHPENSAILLCLSASHPLSLSHSGSRCVGRCCLCAKIAIAKSTHSRWFRSIGSSGTTSANVIQHNSYGQSDDKEFLRNCLAVRIAEKIHFFHALENDSICCFMLFMAMMSSWGAPTHARCLR